VQLYVFRLCGFQLLTNFCIASAAMSSVSDVVQQTINDTLPDLPSSVVNDIVNKITDSGASSPEDLVHVMEQDLVPPLKPIPARKLLNAWRKRGIVNVTCLTYTIACS